MLSGIVIRDGWSSYHRQWWHTKAANGPANGWNGNLGSATFYGRYAQTNVSYIRQPTSQY